MELQLAKIKPDTTTPTAAFTATVLADGEPILHAVKLLDKAFPTLTYTGKGTEHVFALADQAAKQLGHAHLHAYVLDLYRRRDEIRAAQKKTAQQEAELSKLCQQALVFVLPRHQPGEYEVSYQGPKIKGKPAGPDYPEHRLYIQQTYQAVGVKVVRFLNDEFKGQRQLL